MLVAAAILAGCIDVEGIGGGQGDAEWIRAQRFAITSGVPDDGDLGVVALVAGGQEQCTGTLVSERVVLTAAHCLAFEPPEVHFGAGLAAGGILVEVANARRHPAYDPETFDNDIAVLLLTSPAPAEAVPWPMHRTPLDEAWIGRTARVVGFGQTSPTDDQPRRKREGTADISAYGPRELRLEPAPSQPCFGDSGGPAFVTLADGVEYLVGVTFAGDTVCAAYAREIRVDAYLQEFVDPYLTASAEGAAGPGERCFYPEHCAEGDCFVPADAPGFAYCSVPCRGPGDCAVGMECRSTPEGTACRYPEPSPGASGAPCQTGDDCESGVCAVPTGLDQPACTTYCDPTSPLPAFGCPAGQDCVADSDNPDRHVCRVALAGGGCRAAGRRARDGLLSPLLLIAVLWWHRRRRSSAPAPRHPARPGSN